MAWRRPGDKPLSEPMMAWFTDANMDELNNHRIFNARPLNVAAEHGLR